MNKTFDPKAESHKRACKPPLLNKKNLCFCSNKAKTSEKKMELKKIE